MLSKTEILFVRACKSSNPLRRVRSVYRRQYGKYGDPDGALLGILSSFCDKYKVVTISQLLDDLYPSKRELFGIVDEDGYHTTGVKLLISYIRFSKIALYPGFIPPTRYIRAATAHKNTNNGALI